MNRTALQDTLYPDCPIRNILARFGDKWSLLTLYTLAQGGTMRFGALRRAIPDISQKMLATTLRTLAEDGLVARSIYAEVPPRTEYRLTERALTLLPHLDALIGWALDHSREILRDRAAARAD